MNHDNLDNGVPTGQEPVMDAGLRSIIGLAGEGPLQDAINEFLSGKGELLTTARAALLDENTSATLLATYLTTKFKLSPTIANLVAPLLLKLVPSLLGQAKKEKAKPKPKAKPKKKPSASTAKKKKEKKETTTKPKAKPKPKTKPKAETKPKKKTEKSSAAGK